MQNHVVERTLRDGRWASRAVDLPLDGLVTMTAVDEDEGNDYFVSGSNALQPTTLSLARVGRTAARC